MAATDFSLKPKTEDRRPKIVFALIILHLAVALPFAYLLNIWVDEASTLYSTQNGFVQTFQNVFAEEKQAPLYFLILSLWRVLSGSIFFARLFSIVCSVLAIKFFYDLARRVFGEREARFVSVLFALHPFLVWASIEIRVYSLVISLSVLILKLFFEAYFGGDDSKTTNRKQIYFVLTAVAALYANYYLGFLLVGCFAALLATKRFAKAKTYFLQMLVVAVFILPLAFVIKQQLATNSSGFIEEKSVVAAARLLWSHALSIIFPTELFPAPETSIISFLRVWLARFGILWLIVLLVKNKFRALDERVLAFGAIAASVGAFLAAAYFLLGGQYVALRHAAVWFAPLALFVFALVGNVLPRGKSWIFFAAVFTVLYPYSIYKNYPQMAKRGDWARVARFIEEREKPSQPIIVFQSYDALCLPYYYKGANRILPDEKFFAWSAEDLPDSENAMRGEIEFVISEIPPEATEIWLATGEFCGDEKQSAPCRPLENFIQAHYTVEIEQNFYLETVRLLRKK